MYSIVLSVALLLSSCGEKKGTVMVKNEVSNAKMTEITYGPHTISISGLFPAQTSEGYVISDLKREWPKSYQLEFMLEANGRKVYLKTKDKFTIDYDQTLNIVIDDNTEVTN